MANDLTGYVVEQLSGELEVLRNNFTLTRACWVHNKMNPAYKGRGKAKWTKRSTGSVETKTEGTGLTRSTGRTVTAIELNPTTHKVIRFHVEDGEGAMMQIRDYAQQQFKRDLVQLVNTIEAAIAAKQSSLTTNRVGSLGGGINAELLARAKRKILRDQNATAATLLVSSLVEQEMTLDEDIQTYLAQRQDAQAGPNWFLNVFGFNSMGVASNIYSPDTDQHCNLVLAPECIGVAFADLNGEDAGAARFTSPMIDDVTGIPFRIIQGATDDNLGQEFIMDIQYDVEVQQEELGCVILT